MNWKNILWIIIKISILICIYYLIQWSLENTEFPFTNDMMAGTFLLLLTTIIIYAITIIGFIKVKELITTTKLNIGKGILFLIIGAVITLVCVNILSELNIIDSNFMMVFMVMTVSTICLNYGSRINNL